MLLDRFDQKIVALLVEDARLSVSDISRQVNLSRSAVADRIKRLEDQGEITGYHAHVKNLESHRISAYFALSFRPMIRDLIQPFIHKTPEIKLAHYISGDIDLIVLVNVQSMARLTDIRVEMDSWPNIDKIVTHMCLANAVER